MRKAAERLFFLTHHPRFASFIVNRHFRWQVKKASAAKADLYLAHNPGALPVAKAAAITNNAEYGFDAEDFHRQEVSDDPHSKDYRIKKAVEENNLPGVHHFTAASPLIGEEYKQLFPSLKPVTVLNVFPKLQLHNSTPQAGNKDVIRLFWFSQTIGANRGLETIVQAMGMVTDQTVELHLLGNPVNGYPRQLERLAEESNAGSRVYFYPPVPESEIFQLAASCDIGMASEVGTPYNRNICLTNKIFTYIQSGLAVLASNTLAQKKLMEQYPDIGCIYQREDASSLASQLNFYLAHRNELERCKEANYQLGQTKLNWEKEQEKFLYCVEKISVNEAQLIEQ
ncbi:MAG: glycosyltransferase [Chitinophagaceae bacterium]|nr:MAG: glycosyltransferase [Chitinophagaceae bacterium]